MLRQPQTPADSRRRASSYHNARAARFSAPLILPGAAVSLIGLCACIAACVAVQDQNHGKRPTSRPAPQSKPTRFQPGVEIDWSAPAVRLDGEVASRSGGLEFLACFHSREHESVIRLRCAATHVYIALGLIGVSPGHPPKWNQQTGRFEPAAGDLVEIRVEWRHEGKIRSADAFEWLRDTRYGRTVAPRPWIFAGSLRTPDGELESDLSGRGIALVDFPENLLTLSRNHVSNDAELWAEAATSRIPPPRTKVTLVILPAKPRARKAALDFRGDLRLDGKYVTPADFADIVMLNRRLAPAYVQRVVIDRALESDVRRIRRELQRLGVKSEAIEFVGPGS